MKMQLNEIRRMQQLAGIKLNEANNVEISDFNEWLNAIAAAYPTAAKDLQDLGVDLNTATMDSIYKLASEKGKLYNEERGIYKFGKSLSAEPNSSSFKASIRFSSGLETFGYYVDGEGGTIADPETDPSDIIYPPGSSRD